ncbi:MAG: M20 family metallopeptidase [Nocardioidaceae bacterium]|nr:M20 family metallopeptidase [Nocardioidaceae bacterium]
MTPDEQVVLDLISLEEIEDLTRSLVNAPGENPPGREGARVAALAAACAARGLDCTLTEVEPDRPNLCATLAGGAGPGLLLLGHTDVVPIGAGWSVDPRAGVVRDGRLFGRGSTDMLGGLAAILVAMEALRAAGVRLSGPVELAAVVDEEETGKGIRHYLADQDRSHFVGCIVAEPTDLQTIIAARGDAYFEFAFEGRAAHSGRPSEGVNAIYAAASVVGDLQRWNDELAEDAHPLVGPATWSVGLVNGGTGTSIVPAQCSVTADRRLLPREAGSAVIEQVNRRINALGLGDQGATAQVRMTMEMPGFETPADHPFVAVADGAIAAAGGPGLPLGGWTAACDGGFVARDAGVPVVVLGPGSVATQAHRADESVALDELLVAARAYALAAMRVLGEA